MFSACWRTAGAGASLARLSINSSMHKLVFQFALIPVELLPPIGLKQGHNHRRQTKGRLRHGKRDIGRKKNLKSFLGLLARHPKFERNQHRKRGGSSQISDRRQNMAQRRPRSVTFQGYIHHRCVDCSVKCNRIEINAHVVNQIMCDVFILALLSHSLPMHSASLQSCG